MKFNLRVEYANGTVEEVTASASDFVAFEDKYQRSVARLEQELKLTDLVFLAWHSLKRQGKAASEMDKWLDDVDSVVPSDADPKLKA
jgi:hypothetical protein